MNGAYALLLIPAAFLLGILWGPWYVNQLRQLKVGETVREEIAQMHQTKKGTPTMGGAYIIITTLVISLLFVADWRILLPLTVGVLLFTAYGSTDDYAKLRRRKGLGLKVRWKFLWYTLFGLLVGTLIVLSGWSKLWIPFLGMVEIGWWLVPLTAVVIVSMASSAIIDGLDGLCGGSSAIALIAFMAIAFITNRPELGAWCAALVGAILAFLWFNVHPAQMFMGDTGSLPLTVAIGTVAVMSGYTLLLPVIGILFVATLVSVLIQVASVKLRNGKRVFKMTPLHHHFELCGLRETKIVGRYWLVGSIAGTLGIAVAWLSWLYGR